MYWNKMVSYLAIIKCPDPLQVFKDALECLNMLSTQLGDKKFFFGERYA